MCKQCWTSFVENRGGFISSSISLIKKLSSSALLFFLLLGLSFGADTFGPYPAQYVSNTDGDTITFRFEVYPGVTFERRTRLKDIDTPEIGRAKCPEEKQKGQEVQQFVSDILSAAEHVYITVHGFGDFNRPLVTVQLGTIILGQVLIERGYAQPWERGNKPGWCMISQ